jgi:hypothetical protein
LSGKNDPSARSLGNVHIDTALAGQRCLDGVVDVEVVDGLVDALALALDSVEIFDDVAVEDFVDAGKRERGVEAAGDAIELFGAILAGLRLDRLEGALQAIDGEAEGVGELGIEEEIFEDAIGGEVSGVDLAVGFEGGGGAEEAHPLEVLVDLGGAIGLSPEVFVVGLEEEGCGGGALEVAPWDMVESVTP